MSNKDKILIKNDIPEIQLSLDSLKANGIINYEITKVNDNPWDDIISIEILPAGYDLADALNELKYIATSTVH